MSSRANKHGAVHTHVGVLRGVAPGVGAKLGIITGRRALVEEAILQGVAACVIVLARACFTAALEERLGSHGHPRAVLVRVSLAGEELALLDVWGRLAACYCPGLVVHSAIGGDVAGAANGAPDFPQVCACVAEGRVTRVFKDALARAA